MQASIVARTARRVLRAIAWRVAAVVARVAAGVVGNQGRAALVEVSAEQAVAPPTGRWVDAGDVQMFVQEWARPTAPWALRASPGRRDLGQAG